MTTKLAQILWITAALVVACAPTPAGDPGGGGGGGGGGPVTLLDLSGSGIKNSQSFTATAPWTVKYTYDCGAFAGGRGNFIVVVSGNDGTPVAFPVNELGAKGDSSSQVYDLGELHLEINSECPWHVVATQP